RVAVVVRAGKQSGTGRRATVIARGNVKGRRGLRRMSDIIKTQRSLALKAKHNPTHRVDHLYRLLCQDEGIHQAARLVRWNKGAKTAGIDGVRKKTVDSGGAKMAFIREIQRELREHRFRPVPVRRISIPKAKGKKRPRGIATLKDRVVRMLRK